MNITKRVITSVFSIGVLIGASGCATRTLPDGPVPHYMLKQTNGWQYVASVDKMTDESITEAYRHFSISNNGQGGIGLQCVDNELKLVINAGSRTTTTNSIAISSSANVMIGKNSRTDANFIAEPNSITQVKMRVDKGTIYELPMKMLAGSYTTGTIRRSTESESDFDNIVSGLFGDGEIFIRIYNDKRLVSEMTAPLGGGMVVEKILTKCGVSKSQFINT